MLRPLYFMEQVDRGYLVPGRNNKLSFTSQLYCDVCSVSGELNEVLHQDFLLSLCRPSVVRRWMIVRNDLHRLLNLLVAFIFKSLSVAIFAGVDTSTEVIVLRRGGWRPMLYLVRAR